MHVTWVVIGGPASAPGAEGPTGPPSIHVRLRARGQDSGASPAATPGRDLLAWLRRHRGRIVPAALTLLRAYLAAGRPTLGLCGMGARQGWSDLVRSTVVWHGLPDPAETCAGRETALPGGHGLHSGHSAPGEQPRHDKHPHLAFLLTELDQLLGTLGGSATARQMGDALWPAGPGADQSPPADGSFATLRRELLRLFPHLEPTPILTSTPAWETPYADLERLDQDRCA